MRPYRGKRIDNGEEVKGWLFERAGASFIIPITDDYHTPASFALTFVQVDPATVSQQIGRQDKHKKEIYKGDTVLWTLGEDASAPRQEEELEATIKGGFFMFDVEGTDFVEASHFGDIELIDKEASG